MLVYIKIESLDRGAVNISTFQQGQELLIGKGDIAEVVKAPEPLLLVCQRISARLSQNTLWSAIIGCWT